MRVFAKSCAPIAACNKFCLCQVSVCGLIHHSRMQICSSRKGIADVYMSSPLILSNPINPVRGTCYNYRWIMKEIKRPRSFGTTVRTINKRGYLRLASWLYHGLPSLSGYDPVMLLVQHQSSSSETRGFIKAFKGQLKAVFHFRSIFSSRLVRLCIPLMLLVQHKEIFYQFIRDSWIDYYSILQELIFL